MKMTLDVNDILHGERAIRRYVLNLVRELKQAHLDQDMDLLYFQLRKPNQTMVSLEGAVCPRRLRLRRLCLPGGVVEKMWRAYSLPPLSWLTGNVDLYHAPGAKLPPPSSIPTVVTIHALPQFQIPQHFSRQQLDWYDDYFKRCLASADYFITVSETMKADFLKHFSVDASRVRAIPLGVSELFHERPEHEVRVCLKNRFHIDRPYLLYVGGIQRHKNVANILAAYLSFKQRCQSDVMLVLAGDHRSDSAEILAPIAKKSC